MALISTPLNSASLLFITAILFNCKLHVIHCQDSSQFHARRQIFPLETYKDAQLFQYRIPEETLVATWKLWSNATVGCDARTVVVHLRWKGYPVITYQNITFPRNFVSDPSEQYKFTFKSDSKLFTYNLSMPLPGEWYGLAYTERVETRILQRGLFSDCAVWLTSFLTFSKLKRDESLVVLAPSVPTPQLLTQPRIYKFFLPAETLSAKLNITKCSQFPSPPDGFDCPLAVYYRGLSLPRDDHEDFAYNCTIHYNQDEVCYIANLAITRDAWNYILLQPAFGALQGEYFIEFELLLILDECIDGNLTSHVRRIHRIQFVTSTSTTSTTTTSATTTTMPTVITAETNTVKPLVIPTSTDVPAVSESDVPVVSEPDVFSVSESDVPAVSESDENIFTVPADNPQSLHLRHAQRFASENVNFHMCPNKVDLMRFNLPGNFAFRYDKPVSIPVSNWYSPFINIENSNDSDSVAVSLFQFDVLPLIDSGGNLIIDLGMDPSINTTYHNVSVGFCLNYNHYSRSFTDCLEYMEIHSWFPETWNKTLVVPYPRSGHWFITLRSNCTFFTSGTRTMNPVPCEFKTTPVLLDIRLSSCNLDQCGKHGRCYHIISDGAVFSTCVCQSGWKGWWCEMQKASFGDEELLINFLLLTLSNIVFVPSVILSAYRRHFTEALVYLTTMLSSTLYHACDTESAHIYCLLKVNILQFADFYCALLAFWVSLITLANFQEKAKAFLHMFGGIFIGFLVQYDRTSIWAFALPSGLGLFILVIAWIFHCARKRSCFPAGKLWFTSVIPGLGMAVGGLVLYALFETKENYGLTHSCWHVVMALALFLLIPSMKKDVREEEDDLRGKASMQNAKLAHVEWRAHTSFKFLQDDVDML